MKRQVRKYRGRDGEVRFYVAAPNGRTAHIDGTPDDADFSDRCDEALRKLMASGARTQTEEDIAFARIFRKAKHRSAERGHEFDLTVEWIKKLAENQKYMCAVSGMKMKLPAKAGRDPFFMSIDRIDNAKGYTMDNVRLVCLIVNLAMSDWGEAPLIEVANSIAKEKKQA